MPNAKALDFIINCRMGQRLALKPAMADFKKLYYKTNILRDLKNKKGATQIQSSAPL